MLKKYNQNINKKIPQEKKPVSSGVACSEVNCKGEMLIKAPEIKHPEIPTLKRAVCGKCGWRGWV